MARSGIIKKKLITKKNFGSSEYIVELLFK